MPPNTRTLKGQSYSTKRWANLAWPKGSKLSGFSIRRTTGSNTASVRGRNPIRRQRAAANRGSINAAHFFRTAKANKEREIFDNMDNLISQSIQRIANRNRR